MLGKWDRRHKNVKKPRIAAVTADLRGFDKTMPHSPQSIDYDYFLFTDKNFPPRFNAMTPRLQAKIPKCFAWQMVPGYDYYLWTDGTLTLSHKDSLKHFLDNIEGHDLVALKHPRRHSIKQEIRHIGKGLRVQCDSFVVKYSNELLEEQYKAIEDDKDYVDEVCRLMIREKLDIKCLI